MWEVKDMKVNLSRIGVFFFLISAVQLLSVNISHGIIVDYTGGIATLSDTTTVVTTDFSVYSNVDYYIENGFKVDFQGADGIIGNYYGTFPRPTPLNNSVIHGHWGASGLSSIIFTKVDGTAFDLNYLDLTSNTANGGGPATGAEMTYITSSGSFSLLLPSSDWGIDWNSTGTIAGDGVVRMFLGSQFDSISSFTLTSQNAYCIGMDNFYIDEPPPPIPEPSTFMLLGGGLAGLAFIVRRRKSR